MAAAPYILARSLKEAHEFARGELGLAYGRYRIVNTPSTLKSVRNCDLHLVPGWQNRFDRFAMKGAIRWTRMNVIDHAEGVVTDETDGLEPAGVQESLLDATDFFAESTNGNTMISEGGPVAQVVDEHDVKRRRSRCKDCGCLHFKEEPCVVTEPLEGM